MASHPDVTRTESPLDPEPGAAQQRRIKDILVSTVIVGGGSVVTVLCGVARSKVISMTLGAAGVGIQGLLQSVMKTTTGIAGIGLQGSGVREVARLRGSNRVDELGHTLRAIRAASIWLGAIAAVLLVLFQRPIAGLLSLDTATSAWLIGLIAVGVLAQVVFGAYDAFLRGFRRVASLVKVSVAATVLATGTGTGLILIIGTQGIGWALLLQPMLMLAFAALVGRDYSAHFVARDRVRERDALRRVVRLGVAFAAIGLMTTGSQLVARVLVANAATIDEVGYFQAAWAVSVLYLGFVLGAMSQDYYPRLAELAGNGDAISSAVNDQAKVSFLLAGPAMLGLLTLSEPIVALLYSPEFAPSVELLRWQLLGDVLKVGSWTLGYLVLAQGRPRIYFFTELSWNAAYLGCLALLLPSIGVEATAAAYVASSLVYFLVLCYATNRLIGFTWSRENVALMSVITALAAAVMAAHLLLDRALSLVLSLSITAAFGGYCLRRILTEAGFKARLRRR